MFGGLGFVQLTPNCWQISNKENARKKRSVPRPDKCKCDCVLKNPSACSYCFQSGKMRGKRNQMILGGRRQFVRLSRMHSCNSFFVTFSRMHKSIKCCKERISLYSYHFLIISPEEENLRGSEVWDRAKQEKKEEEETVLMMKRKSLYIIDEEYWILS